MEQHLPVLLIVLPMLAAPLCALLAKPRLVWPFAALVAFSTFGVCLALLGRVVASGPVSYALGDWAPPLGIEYRVDLLNGLVLPLVSGIASIVLLYAPRSLAAEVPRSRHGLFYAVYLLCLAGLLGMTVTGDAFNVFVFLEIASLSMYTLVSLGPDRRALMSAFRYLVLGTIGGTFYLIGVGLLYMVTGTLNMLDLAARLPALADNRVVLAGFAFISVGLALKMALFPLHTWLPGAYTYAPSAVTSFLAATATKVSVYVIVRMTFTVLGVGFAFGTVPLDALLLPLALLGIFVASTVAIFQTNAKRMFAWSSVAQIGYIALGIGLASVAGLAGGLVHVLNHALTKGGIFMALGCMALRTGSVDLDDLRGIGRRMPWTTLAFVVGGLGMIGVPLTAGFVSKWYLVGAAFERGSYLVGGLLLLASLLAVVYVWRVVEVAYFREPEPTADVRLAEAPLSMLLPTWVLVGASVWFGVDAQWTAGLATDAARMLFGGAP